VEDRVTLPARILDFHVHPVQVHEQRPWARDLYHETAPDIASRLSEFEDPRVLHEHLLSEGVHEAVVIAEVVPLTSGLVGNERICDYARAGNEAAGETWLHPFVSLNPWIHVDLPGELDSLCERWRVAGVKLTPPYQYFYPADARMYPLYARCQELGLPVLFHTGTSAFRGTRLKYADPLLLDDVAIDFPQLNIVLAHAGRGLWYDAAALMARLHENVFLEISGLPPRQLPTYFPELDRLGGKVIFGSDWPVLPSLAKNVQAVANLFGERAEEVLFTTGKGLLPA
jgi:uncharacterized protein